MAQKLYTEEQVKNMLNMTDEVVNGDLYTYDEIIKSQTPIELPSDKEIVNNACTNPITEDFMNDRQIGFVKGCKWMKEQILNQNK